MPAAITSQPLFLAIDQGGQSSRVAIYDKQGLQLACFSALCTTKSYTAADGSICVEQDGAEILAGVREGLAQVAQFLGDDIRRVQAAGFAGQGSSLVCWHQRTGALLSPVLSWQDRRAAALIEVLPLTQQQVQERSGLRSSPHYGASKIRWCLDNLPEVQSAHAAGDARIGPIVSYLFWHLLRADDAKSPAPTRVDPGHAQRTLLWSLANNDWDALLLTAFGVDPSLLPACCWHNSRYGNLVVGEYPIPLLSCQRDQGASLFARGAPDASACYVNIGTGAFIQRISAQLIAPEGLLISPLWFPEPAQGAKTIYAWEATVNGAAAALDWLATAAGVASITPALVEKALQLHPQQEIYFLNAVGGLSAPYWRTDLTSRFSPNLSADEKILAWIESVLFQITINVQLMQTAGALQKIYISGGLSRADGVCQKLADLSGLHVICSDNSDATLQGVAFTAAGMPENWRTGNEDDIFYPGTNELLQKRFTIWQDAMHAWLAE